MAPGFPGILGRTGFRGFPHAARRMLSYQQAISDFSDSSHRSSFGSTTTSKHIVSKVRFKTSESINNTRQIKSFRKNSVKNQRHSDDINGILNADSSSRSVYPYEKYEMKDLGKGPRQHRSLLWSPPQIISSVLKVFRKVLSIYCENIYFKNIKTSRFPNYKTALLSFTTKS